MVNAVETSTRTGGLMKFECDSCHAQYMIADEKVGKRGVKVKCKKCQHVIIVRPERSADGKDAAKGGKRAKEAPAVEASQDTVAQQAPAGMVPPVAQNVVDPPAFDPAAFDPAAFDAAAEKAAAEGDTFASGGMTEPARPSLQAETAAGPDAEAPGVGSSAEDPEHTGPGRKPAPVSMFGDATQLTQNPMAGASLSDERRGDDRTELAQPPQMTAAAEPTVVVRQELPPEPPPATDEIARSPPPSTAQDELGDQLSGMFNAMFDASPAPAAAAVAPADDDEHRGPTVVLDAGAVAALRKAATPSELEPGLVAVRRDELAGGAEGGAAAGADDGPAEQVWHAAIDDQDVGPLSLAEVGRHIEGGRVDRETLVWKVGMNDWLPAGDVPEVRALFDKVPMPRIPRLDEEPRRGGFVAEAFAAPPVDDGIVRGQSPFEPSQEEDASWRPHGLTDVYQAANLAEVAGMGGLGALGAGAAIGVSGPVKMPSSSSAPMASSSEPEWRPGAASALASLVQDEIKRLDNGPPPASDDDLAPADDASINAPLFGGLSAAKELEAGPEVSDPMARAPRPTSSMPAYEPPPPSYAPPQPFLSTPPQPQPNRMSPMVLGAIIAGAVAILVVVVLIAVIAGGKEEPTIVVGADGKAYVMGPNKQLIALGAAEAGKEPAQAAPSAPDAAPAKGDVLAVAVPPPAAAPAAGATSPAAAPGAEPPKAEADPADGARLAEPAAASPPAEEGAAPAKPQKEVRRTTSPPRPPKPPPPSPPKPTPKGCDPVLDFDCKPGSAAPSGGGGGEVKASLSKTDVLVVVKANMGKVAACGNKTKTSGIIKMSWKIQPSGKTTDVSVADSKFAGTPVGSCAVGEIKKWKFPASKATTPVSFPMKLGG